MKFGIEAKNMHLQLRDTNEEFVCDMADDSNSLGSHGVHEFYTIHVVDQNPAASNLSEFENVEGVEKYQISDESYNKRTDTFRHFKNEMQKVNPEFMKPKPKTEISDDHQEEEAKAISIGNRCELNIGKRRGEVMFVGKVDKLGKGFWIGVKLDEPSGDSNGTIDGT